MTIEDKPWGQTHLLYHSGLSQVNRITVVAGGYSSRHCHSVKANVFVVLRGTLLVSTYEIVDNKHLRVVGRATLAAGSTMTVLPQVIHRFYAMEYTEAIEAYYAPDGGEVKLDDIIRFDINGVVPRQADDHSAADRA